MRCRGCSLPFGDASARRKLGSRATKHVIPLFTEILEEKFPGFCVTEAHIEADDSYLCQPCFRRLDSMIKLKHQLQEKRKMVADNLERSVSAGAVSLTGRAPRPSSPCTPSPAKRPLTAEEAGSTPRRKRRRLDTPTRRAIGRLQPAQSPLVAVCIA